MKFASVPITRVREYWDLRPSNIRHSPQPVGTKQYFDEVEARKYFVEPHIPQFAEFPRWRGKRVLEIGCGIGTDTVNFARQGAQVTAVDLSEKSLELARQHLRVNGLENQVRFHLANAEELSRHVPAEPYDLIYSFGVIHHTPHPEAVFEELRKFARPGTTLKIMVYHRRSWKVFRIVASEGKGSSGNSRNSSPGAPKRKRGVRSPTLTRGGRDARCPKPTAFTSMMRAWNTSLRIAFPITFSTGMLRSPISGGCRAVFSMPSKSGSAGTSA